MRDITGLFVDGRASDLRKNGNADRKLQPKHQKHDVDAVWEEAFPGVPQPYSWGCLPFRIYPALEEAGYRYSSKYGWRKKS